MTFTDFAITWLCGYATAVGIRWWMVGFRIRRTHRARAIRMLPPESMRLRLKYMTGDFKP